MKYDIAIRIVLQNGQVLNGFAAAEPKESSLDDVRRVHDDLQRLIPNASYLCIFSREMDPMEHAKNVRATEQAEYTIPGDVLKTSVVVTQIVRVAD